MSVQGQGAGAAPQRAPSDASPIIDGVNTLNNLEKVVALDQAFVLTSIAVSLKRIADSQLVLTGGSGANHQANYILGKINDSLKELVGWMLKSK